MKTIKKVTGFLIVIMMISSLAACNVTKEAKENRETEETKETKENAEVINYTDAESFEAALNNGENLEGTIVQFVAGELKPDSAFGYNIWAGEHLNFISSGNPDVKQGDTVVVKATAIENRLGSWIINYEKVNHAVIDDSTSSSNGILSFNADNPRTSEQPLELVDYGWFINPPSGDTAYVEFCGIIYNPNGTLAAQFPKVIVTVKNGDGSIAAAEEQTGSIVMPNDTVTLCGMFSVQASDLTDDTQIIFDVDWSDLGSGMFIYSAAKTTDFAITNVSERSGSDENFITGEITNNYTQEIDQVNLSIVLRKDNKIVYMENTFLEHLEVGKAKAFEFQRYGEYPEHDTVDVSAMVW